MALRPQLNFSSGELDPALHERTNLDKYNSSLATARNVAISKTGRLVSRPGTKSIIKCRPTNEAVRCFTIQSYGLIIELGHYYLRAWDINGTFIEEFGTYFTEDDLPNIRHVQVSENEILFLLEGETPLSYKIGSFTSDGSLYFRTPLPPTSVSLTEISAPTGYDVEYVATMIVNGQESDPVKIGTSGKLPIAAGDSIELIAEYDDADIESGDDADEAVTEMRVYRRPLNGGAYGYIGSSSYYTMSGADIRFKYIDFGGEADYSKQPPAQTPNILSNGASSRAQDLGPRCGVMYQQRLIIAADDKIEASRTGYPMNFTRDFPYTDDSAISMVAGTNGYTQVLDVVENDGLAVFTTQGILVHTGALTPTNLALIKRANNVIDRDIPAIAIPGGILFVDETTNTVRELRWSEDGVSFTTEEVSVISDHLFVENKITSWAFQSGPLPLLWITFSDGTCASFTYEKEYGMKAWTRHDMRYDVEQVVSIGRGPLINTTEIQEGGVFFVINKDGQRYIEKGIRRYNSVDEITDNLEADKIETIAAMDGVYSWSRNLTEEAPSGLTLTPVTPDVWDGNLTLSAPTSGLFTDPGLGEVGTVFRWFHPTDKNFIDLTVASRTSDHIVVVTPSEEFPSDYDTDPNIYETKNLIETTETNEIGLDMSAPLPNLSGVTWVAAVIGAGTWSDPITLTASTAFMTVASRFFPTGTILRAEDGLGGYIDLGVVTRVNSTTLIVQPDGTFPSGEAADVKLFYRVDSYEGLEHLEDEEVSVIVDGFVVASPNNSIEDYDTLTVNNNELTLPDSRRGAFIHIGRPYVMDVETLDIDTVEQRPVMIESKTVNKLYMRVYKSRGLYIANDFPDNDQLDGMDASGIREVSMDDTDTIPVDYNEDLIGNVYDRPRSKRVEITLPGDWKSNGRVCIRQVDPLHFEILSIIPDVDVEDLRRRGG